MSVLMPVVLMPVCDIFTHPRYHAFLCKYFHGMREREIERERERDRERDREIDREREREREREKEREREREREREGEREREHFLFFPDKPSSSWHSAAPLLCVPYFALALLTCKQCTLVYCSLYHLLQYHLCCPGTLPCLFRTCHSCHLLLLVQLAQPLCTFLC